MYGVHKFRSNTFIKKICNTIYISFNFVNVPSFDIPFIRNGYLKKFHRTLACWQLAISKGCRKFLFMFSTFLLSMISILNVFVIWICALRIINILNYMTFLTIHAKSLRMWECKSTNHKILCNHPNTHSFTVIMCIIFHETFTIQHPNGIFIVWI